MSDEETQVSRREFVHTGLQLGAALGVSGLGGLTIVGEAGAQTKRQYPWESLPAGETVPPTKLQLRTIGLGVSVQDRFLREFERRTGHKATGKVTGLTPMITEWLAGGYRNYDTNETNANRNAALWSAKLLQPIPVDKVVPWKSARDLFANPKALGHDEVSGWPLVEIWVNPKTQQEFKLVPQFFNCDSIGISFVGVVVAVASRQPLGDHWREAGDLPRRFVARSSLELPEESVLHRNAKPDRTQLQLGRRDRLARRQGLPRILPLGLRASLAHDRQSP